MIWTIAGALGGVAILAFLLQVFNSILESKLKTQIGPIKQDIDKLKEGQTKLEAGQANLEEKIEVLHKTMDVFLETQKELLSMFKKLNDRTKHLESNSLFICLCLMATVYGSFFPFFTGRGSCTVQNVPRGTF